MLLRPPKPARSLNNEGCCLPMNAELQAGIRRGPAPLCRSKTASSPWTTNWCAVRIGGRVAWLPPERFCGRGRAWKWSIPPRRRSGMPNTEFRR
jgi:hypothetical protein